MTVDGLDSVSSRFPHGVSQGKLRVALFLARKATGLETLVATSRQGSRPYEIAGALLATAQSHAVPVLDRWRIPWRVNDLRAFCATRGAALRDLAVRAEYDRRSLQLVREFRPASLALYGYIYILTEPILGAYSGRIVNVHDSDLTVLNGDGTPRFPGLHATRNAIVAGEHSTRSCVHLVTEELDAGPVLARSRPYAVHAAFSRNGSTKLTTYGMKPSAGDGVKVYAYALRERMMGECWPLLMDEALRAMAARGRSLEDGGSHDGSNAWRTP